MDRNGRNANVLRFGPFELDTARAELRRGDATVRLKSQQFQLLALLADRAGQVVSREEIRGALWSDTTFVDFDQSINVCVNKIREALEDDPQSPDFIETVPRQGYRFIVPIKVDGRASDTLRSTVTKAIRSRPWMLIAVTALVLTGITTAAMISRTRHQVKPIESLAVLLLENLSQDGDQEYFADGMTDDLITDLAKISAL
jgi:DNA-binding winged helix-turn-helix (wHTH) protein